MEKGQSSFTIENSTAGVLLSTWKFTTQYLQWNYRTPLLSLHTVLITSTNPPVENINIKKNKNNLLLEQLERYP